MRTFALFSVLLALVISPRMHADAVKPTIVVSPPSPRVGDTVTFSGCNVDGRPKDVSVQMYGPNNFVFGFATHTDETGCWVGYGFVAQTAGVYEAYLFIDRSRGDGPGTYRYNHPDAELEFDVSP